MGPGLRDGCGGRGPAHGEEAGEAWQEDAFAAIIEVNDEFVAVFLLEFLDPACGVDNFLFANGFSGHGLQHSLGIGRALSELVTYGAYQTINLDAFGWERVLNHRPLLETNII